MDKIADVVDNVAGVVDKIAGAADKVAGIEDNERYSLAQTGVFCAAEEPDQQNMVPHTRVSLLHR